MLKNIAPLDRFAKQRQLPFAVTSAKGCVVFYEDNMLACVRNDWIEYTLSKFKQYYCEGAQSISPPLKHWQQPASPPQATSQE